MLAATLGCQVWRRVSVSDWDTKVGLAAYALRMHPLGLDALLVLTPYSILDMRSEGRVTWSRVLQSQTGQAAGLQLAAI